MLNQQNRLLSYIPQYNIILKEISRVTCNLHFPFADVLLSVHQFSAFKSTLKVSVVGAISALEPFFFFNLLKIERERVDCKFKTSHPHKSTLSMVWNVPHKSSLSMVWNVSAWGLFWFYFDQDLDVEYNH